MAVIDSAYQYYLSTYAGSGMSRYDTHKKSQLRAVYNNIVKVNKDSPLYKINFTRDTGRFAIDIKEQARSIEKKPWLARTRPAPPQPPQTVGLVPGLAPEPSQVSQVMEAGTLISTSEPA